MLRPLFIVILSEVEGSLTLSVSVATEKSDLEILRQVQDDKLKEVGALKPLPHRAL
jgi:hypothetical protein